MLYRIADLNLEMPDLGDMPERMQSYRIPEGEADLTIEASELIMRRWGQVEDKKMVYYMETGWIFYSKLLLFEGMMLHASAVVMDGYAYLFSGPSGMGKSTHTGLYLKNFGSRARIINDDKPALRRMDGIWYAYGTPWCGKDGININEKARLGGICFLRRGDTRLTRLTAVDAVHYILSQTQRHIDPEKMRMLLASVHKLVTEVPVFEFYNHADRSDAELTYKAMQKAAEEKAYET